MRLNVVAAAINTPVLLVLLLCGTDLGAEPSGSPPSLDQAIKNDKSSFYVRADVNHATRDYREGDALSIRVITEASAYVNVYYQQADGVQLQIFPNRLQPDNFVEAGQTIQIPAKDDLFRWAIGPPFGKEVIKVVATKEAVEAFNAPDLRKDRFNRVAPEVLRGIELELGEESPSEWAEYYVPIHTHARADDSRPTGSRRYGLFIGVSEYQFNAEYEQAVGKPLNLKSAHKDARDMMTVLREVGQFADIRIYTNEQATRENIEQAIVNWLPSVSRPGDSVLIYYAGHGMQIPDDNGDERDRPHPMDELLVPHDIAMLPVVQKVIEKINKKEQVNVQPHQIERWSEILRRSEQRGKNASLAFMQETAITDDTFGRWLQNLDGRQVMIIVDACKSGGLAADEKGFLAPRQKEPFDFMERELVRLRDIGQRETSLLTACMTAENARELNTINNGLMTFILLETLRKKSGPLTIDEGYEFCKVGVKRFFTDRKKQEEQHPLLYTIERTRPAYLKP